MPQGGLRTTHAWDRLQSMEALCHRCGASLSVPDLFCPNCGAPQVKFGAAEGEAGHAADPRLPRSRPQGIRWDEAVRAALLVAVPAGVLSAISVLSWGSCLWVVGGAALAIGLYRKRAAGSLLDTRSGLRIGSLAGLIAAYVSVGVTAAWRVFARFVLHQGGDIDRAYDSAIRQVMASAAQSDPSVQAQLGAIVRLLLSPEGKAGLMLWSSLLSGAGIILFSALGGALGVRIFSARKQP